VQVGGDKGEVNPADMLKPYLARGEFQTIGATTTDEYKKYIEKYLNDLDEKLYSKEKESNMVKLLENTLGEEVLEVQKEVEKRINKIGARFKKDGKVLIAELT
jgi:predicted RNA-binding protein